MKYQFIRDLCAISVLRIVDLINNAGIVQRSIDRFACGNLAQLNIFMKADPGLAVIKLYADH